VARVYGSEPQFLLASATIANPGELAHALLGVEATTIGDDAAPRAEQTIALWNPELIDAELGIRASALGDASRIMAELVQHDLRTICFAKSRKSAELIHRMTSDRVDTATAKRLAPYRAGYTPHSDGYRTPAVEGSCSASRRRMHSSSASASVSDCAISVGFPGTTRACAVGTRRARALAVLVVRDALASTSALEKLLDAVEAAILDHANPRVLGHVASAIPRPVDVLAARSATKRSRGACVPNSAHKARLCGRERLSGGARRCVGKRGRVHGDGHNGAVLGSSGRERRPDWRAL
jgi:DEAD/DEAH box helicase domain-containing protein